MTTAMRPGKYSWMKIAHIMTEAPLALNPSATVGDAHELMFAHNIRQIPIVNGKKLVGIVTDRDIRSFVGDDLDPERREKALSTPVRDVMTSEPITLSPDAGLQKALELFIDSKVGGIPVIDKSAGLLGIVTYIDLLRCFLNRIEED